MAKLDPAREAAKREAGQAAKPSSAPAKQKAASPSPAADGEFGSHWEAIVKLIQEDPSKYLVMFLNSLVALLSGMPQEIAKEILKRIVSALQGAGGNTASAPTQPSTSNPPPPGAAAPPGTPAGAPPQAAPAMRPAA